jgi:uncharacterized membrane protein
MADFWTRLELLPLAAHIGETWWFPLLESLHVLTAMFVVGSIVFVDLRLLGLSAMRYPARRFMHELIRWTWASFAVATVTGLGMFLTRASWYVSNPAFQAKLLLLALAGANMAIFQWLGQRDIERWDTAASTSTAARIAGAASIICWIGVTLAGRWTGHLS